MEKANPLVSFIIPVYNIPAPMLRECVESILALALRPYEREIIVIDDGSAVSALSGLGALSDELIYIRQRNAGVSVARNLGMRMATGTFIQFVDGDDRLMQPPYEHVLDLLRYEHCDMVLFDFCSNGDSQADYDDGGPMTGNEMLRCQNIHGSACSYIFSRSILGSLTFTPGVRFGEDEEFTPQLMLRAERVKRTTAKAYLYRRRDTSVTGTDSIRSHLSRLIDTRDVIFRLSDIASSMPPEERVAMQRRTAQLTMDYIYNVIVITRSSHYLDRKLKELARKGLFPLPNRNYTAKYTWFRRMTNTKIGRAVLLRTLPMIRTE